jgi:hypothetical protein
MFVQELREELMTGVSVPMTSAAIDVRRANGRIISVPPASTWSAGLASAQPRRWAFSHAATAALILLILIGSLGAVGLHQRGSEQQSLVIPAMDGTPPTAIPPDGTVDNLVLQAKLETLGEMPDSRAQHQLALSRYRLAPGAVQPVGNQEDTGVGITMFSVEAGQITVEPDAPVLVTRAGADPASAPGAGSPSAAIVLTVGDQLFAPSGVSLVRRNNGPDPAIVLELSLGSVGDNYFDWTVPEGVTSDAGFPYKLLDSDTLPIVPAEAAVHRWTLAPGAELPVRDVPGVELVYVESGELDLVFDKGGTLNTPERVRTLSSGNGTDVFGRTPERAVLANRGTEPLVLLTASIVPTTAAGAAAQAPEAEA